MITVGSLFSGIGGLELGLERTGGFRTIWFCENDRYASAVLKKHWPGVPNYGDITKVDYYGIRRPDMVTGGFPCQDISVAGRGEGIKEGTRSGLWKEYARAIGILRPKLALIENVPMLANRGLDIVLSDLAAMGYDAEWFLLSAAQTGAWHRRERIFIMAYPYGERLEKQGPQPRLHTRKQEIYLSDTNSTGFQEEGPKQQATGTSGDCENVPDSENFGWERHRDTWKGRDGPQNTCENVSDSEDEGNTRRKRFKANDGEESPVWRDNPGGSGADDGGEISNTESVRIQRSGTVGEQIAQLQALERLSRCHCARNRGEIWKAEPGVGRVVDGVSNRVDRIKCLGNAVVPQVAETIGHWILEREVSGS